MLTMVSPKTEEDKKNEVGLFAYVGFGACLIDQQRRPACSVLGFGAHVQWAVSVVQAQIQVALLLLLGPVGRTCMLGR